MFPFSKLSYMFTLLLHGLNCTSGDGSNQPSATAFPWITPVINTTEHTTASHVHTELLATCNSIKQSKIHLDLNIKWKKHPSVFTMVTTTV